MLVYYYNKAVFKKIMQAKDDKIMLDTNKTETFIPKRKLNRCKEECKLLVVIELVKSQM